MNRSPWERLSVGICILALCAVSIFATTTPTLAAGPPPGSKHIGHSIVLVDTADHSFVALAPDSSVRDKSQWTPDADIRSLRGGDVGILGCGWPNCNPASLSASYTKTITPPGGSSGPIKVYFSSSDPYTIPETRVTFNGSSYAKWLGSTPYNATKVTDTDTWKASGIAVSISLPPGIGFSGSGDTATWTTSVSNNWQINHYFNNVQFNAFDIWAIDEYVSGTFQFGTSFWRIDAHDSSLT